jgi:hypothetical protein
MSWYTLAFTKSRSCHSVHLLSDRTADIIAHDCFHTGPLTSQYTQGHFCYGTHFFLHTQGCSCHGVHLLSDRTNPITVHTSITLTQGRSHVYSTALPLPVVAAAQTALAVSNRCVYDMFVCVCVRACARARLCAWWPAYNYKQKEVHMR